MDEVGSKTVSIPLFSGEQEKFQIWWMRFTAFATVKKFKKALKEGGDSDLPPRHDSRIDTSTDEGKKQQSALDRNEMAVACFSIAFTTEGMLSMVVASMTDAWPEGNAGEIVRLLNVKFKPQDLLSKCELRARLHAVKMDENDDPQVLFEQIESIRN